MQKLLNGDPDPQQVTLVAATWLLRGSGESGRQHMAVLRVVVVPGPYKLVGIKLIASKPYCLPSDSHNLIPQFWQSRTTRWWAQAASQQNSSRIGCCANFNRYNFSQGKGRRTHAARRFQWRESGS